MSESEGLSVVMVRVRSDELKEGRRAREAGSVGWRGVGRRSGSGSLTILRCAGALAGGEREGRWGGVRVMLP